MMKTVVSLAGLAGYAMAQGAYGGGVTSAPAASSTGFACNPAHQYPAGEVCTEINGSLTLVTAAPSSTTYACNPAHQYPAGQVCTEINGSLTLVSTANAPPVSFTPTAPLYPTNGTTPAHPTDATITQIVTAFTTYCPHPTTMTYNSKTYTVTEATTLTITDCPCTLHTPAASLPPAQTVTALVSSYTTVCPSPTTLTVNSKTYTVTEPTTLTITHCPGGCEVTTPVSCLAPPPTSAAPPAPGKPSTTPVAPMNGTTPNYPTASGSLTPYTGGVAEKVVAGGSGLFAAVVAVLFL